MESLAKCSQEIETSSTSMKNSKKVLDISELFVRKWEELNKLESRTTPAVKISSVPVLDKTEFIESWIRSNIGELSDDASEKSCPNSPRASRQGSEYDKQKRFSSSPIGSHRSKQSRKNNRDAKENSGYLDERLSKIKTQEETVSGPLRNVENKLRNGDRVVCRFSWHGKSETKSLISGNSTKNLSRESTIVADKKSCESCMDDYSSLRKTPSRSGYRLNESPRKERTVLKQNAIAPENSYRGRVQFESKSPLSWRRRSTRNFSTTESPLLPDATGVDSPTKCSIFNRNSFIRNSTPKVQKNGQRREEESPLRWNGYWPKIYDRCEIPETLALPSPIRETEVTIHSSSSNDPSADLNLDDKSPQKSVKSLDGENFKIADVETPSSCWNRCKALESPKFPAAFSPLSEIVFSQSSPGSIPNKFHLIADNQASPRNSKHRKRPVNLKTFFDSNDDQSERSEMLNLPDTRPVSSTKSETVEINVEALNKNHFNEEHPKIEVELESQSDVTISDLIENIFTQGTNISKHEENIVERTLDYDSDATYCSKGDLACNAPEINSSPERSEKISQNMAIGHAMLRNKSSLISQASSDSRVNEEQPIFIGNANPPRIPNKRTKRAKKGSLVAKLQTLVNRQISNLHLWRYQMSRAEMKNSRAQFIKLSIRKRETRYGRHFLLATLLEDSYDLLSDFFVPDEKKSTAYTLTLMILPEVNGTTKISDGSILDVYPPWEVMSMEERVICVIYFDVETRNAKANVSSERSENTKLLQKFECPCLRSGTIDDTCPVKFTSTKTSVMQTILDSQR